MHVNLFRKTKFGILWMGDVILGFVIQGWVRGGVVRCKKEKIESREVLSVGDWKDGRAMQSTRCVLLDGISIYQISISNGAELRSQADREPLETACYEKERKETKADERMILFGDHDRKSSSWSPAPLPARSRLLFRGVISQAMLL